MVLDERRRCAEIFGVTDDGGAADGGGGGGATAAVAAAVAPASAAVTNALVGKIMRETFAPINPSFVGRLRGGGQTTPTLPQLVELYAEVTRRVVALGRSIGGVTSVARARARADPSGSRRRSSRAAPRDRSSPRPRR